VCRKSGGDLEQIQFLLGLSSIQATEKYYVQKLDMCSEVSLHEFFNGVPVTALRVCRGQAVQNGGFCLIQIG